MANIMLGLRDANNKKLQMLIRREYITTRYDFKINGLLSVMRLPEAMKHQVATSVFCAVNKTILDHITHLVLTKSAAEFMQSIAHCTFEHMIVPSPRCADGLYDLISVNEMDRPAYDEFYYAAIQEVIHDIANDCRQEFYEILMAIYAELDQDIGYIHPSVWRIELVGNLNPALIMSVGASV